MTPIPEFLIPISRVVEYIIQFPLFITIMDDLSPILNPDSNSPYQLILRALLMIPISHYLIGFAISVAVFLYNFLELHLIRDILTGFRGQPITLTFNSESKFYEGVVSKCRVLHGRLNF